MIPRNRDDDYLLIAMSSQSKTFQEWFSMLPEPYRSKALANIDPGKIDVPAPALCYAIQNAFRWNNSPEGYNFWSHVRNCIALNRPLPPLSAEAAYAVEALNTTHTPNHMNYSDKPVATPTLVFGTDVADMNAAACISAIKANNASIKDLQETGIESAYIQERINGLKSANEVLVKRLDSFASTPAPAAE